MEHEAYFSCVCQTCKKRVAMPVAHIGIGEYPRKKDSGPVRYRLRFRCPYHVKHHGTVTVPYFIGQELFELGAFFLALPLKKREVRRAIRELRKADTGSVEFWQKLMQDGRY